MEENIYTEDEKELLGILEFLIHFHKTVEYENDEAKAGGENIMKTFEAKKDEIINMVNKRFERLEKDNQAEGKDINSYYDEICTKCGFFSSYRPLQIVKDQKGYSYYEFYCPKCQKNFVAEFPFDDHEKLACMDAYIVMVSKKDKYGKAMIDHPNVPREVFDKFLKSTEAFREGIRKYDESKAAMIAFDDQCQKVVKQNLEVYRPIKKRIVADFFKTDIN